MIGRSGSLAYLDRIVAQDVGPSGERRPTALAFVSSKTLRSELAWNTFGIRSLPDEGLLRALKLHLWRLRLCGA